MQDRFGRNIDYLRISVTDKCNLRCKYCMPEEGVELLPHEEMLTLEEVYRLVRIMEGMGIQKVRLTGGEPLVRKNLTKLVKDIGMLPGIREIAMTTNGVLFARHAKELKAAGLTAVNISLDTLDAGCFEQITGFDRLPQVLEAMEEALNLGLKVKVNCVPCRGINDDHLAKLAALAKDKPVDVRYIELMPVGCGKQFEGILSDEILKQLEEQYGKAADLAKSGENKYLTDKVNTTNTTNATNTEGPARYYQFPGFCGRIGFISPLSHKFCSECNRIRLTAEGRLKLCLHYNHGLELKPLLRGGASDEEIGRAIQDALQGKPREHDFAHEGHVADSETKKMVQIGG